MADAKISELIQRTPNGQEFFEVIIPPFTAGTNRKVLLSDLNQVLLFWPLSGTEDLAGNVTINLAGNDLSFNGGASTARVILSAENNVARIFSFRTNNVHRFAFRVDGDETGSDAGGDFFIRRYDDAGNFIDAPISIIRSTGLITISGPLKVTSGTPGAGKVLTSDADGDASWEAPSGGSVALTNVSISVGVLALDFVNAQYIDFDLTTTASTDFEITHANISSMRESSLFLRITGTVNIEMPTSVIMSRAEEIGGRWNTTTHILTVIGITASPFLIQFTQDAVGNVWAFCSERGV